MKSSPSDLHDDVPELFPSDTWEDARQLVKDTEGAAAILPPRRPQPEGSQSQTSEGLRIGVATLDARKDVDDENRRLDVHEIDGSVVRLEPEQPSQPKVPRQVAFHEQPAAQPREAESAAWGVAKKYSPKWIAGISIGIVALVIASVSLLPLINRSNAASSTPSEPSHAPVAEPESRAAEPDAYDDLVSRPDEAMKIFRKLATTPHAEDFLPMVRDRSAVEPLIQSSRHAVVISKHWSPDEDARWEVHQNDGLPYALLKGEMPDYSEFCAYFVMANDQLLIDWKATTGYGTATYEDLARNQGDPAEIRGVLSQSGHYSPIFPESSFRSYLLEGPDPTEMIWCYTRRGTTVDERIAKLFTGGAILRRSIDSQKVTLQLEHAPENALPNQWLIAELLHKDWISP